MSKVLAEEYKKLAENDLPDLWGRIEAGLTEKTVAVDAKPVRRVHKDFTVEDIKTVKLDAVSYESPKMRFSRFTHRYGSILAVACILALIVTPLVYLTRNFYRADQESANAMLAFDEATGGAGFDTVLERAVAAPDLAVLADDALDAGLVMPGNTTQAVDTAGPDLNSGDFDVAGSGQGEPIRLDPVEARAHYFRTEQTEAIIEIPGVALEVAAMHINTDAGTAPTYTATVIADELALLNVGSSIAFTPDENLGISLSVGEIYSLDLIFDENNECYFIATVLSDPAG